MHYEVNVTKWKDGRTVHWFATHERSITTQEEAEDIASALRSLPDAAHVTVTRWETIGTPTSI